MMLEIGQEFNKNGSRYCLLEILEYNLKKYVLFSVESEKIEYLFYEVFQEGKNYNFSLVTDEETKFALYEQVEFGR